VDDSTLNKIIVQAYNNVIDKESTQILFPYQKAQWMALKLKYENDEYILQNNSYQPIVYLEDKYNAPLPLHDYRAVLGLLAEGLNPNHKNEQDIPYWRVALNNSNPEIFSLLFNKLTPENKLEACRVALLEGKRTLIELLLQERESVLKDKASAFKLRYKWPPIIDINCVVMQSAQRDVADTAIYQPYENVLQNIIGTQKFNVAQTIFPLLTQENKEYYFEQCFDLDIPEMLKIPYYDGYWIFAESINRLLQHYEIISDNFCSPDDWNALLEKQAEKSCVPNKEKWLSFKDFQTQVS
jgi:hypothetical protein